METITVNGNQFTLPGGLTTDIIAEHAVFSLHEPIQETDLYDPDLDEPETVEDVLEQFLVNWTVESGLKRTAEEILTIIKSAIVLTVSELDKAGRLR